MHFIFFSHIYNIETFKHCTLKEKCCLILLYFKLFGIGPANDIYKYMEHEFMVSSARIPQDHNYMSTLFACLFKVYLTYDWKGYLLWTSSVGWWWERYTCVETLIENINLHHAFYTQPFRFTVLMRLLNSPKTLVHIQTIRWKNTGLSSVA